MNKQEILDEIDVLEHSETTYQNCTKLAVLYQIRNNLIAPAIPQVKEIAGYSYADSEFINAFLECPQDKALDIIDEHMDAIKLLHPKEYSAIISMLKEKE